MPQIPTRFMLVDRISVYVYEFFVNFYERRLGNSRSYLYLGLDIESETSNNTIK